MVMLGCPTRPGDAYARGRQRLPEVVRIHQLLKKYHNLEKKWISKDVTDFEGLVLRNLLQGI